jgi:superoxide dismutase, Cu-Zn family
MRVTAEITMLAAALLAGCTSLGARRTAAMGAETATATLTDAAGATRATARLVALPQGVQLTVEARGMAPGSYGIHVHQVGRCDAPGFTTAGAHWNPAMKQHGSENPAGPHLGDLPNLRIEATGTGTLVAAIDGATLTGGANPILDADGAALMIHAAADDYRTDPSGNSGARIACGVIAPAGGGDQPSR